jgi:Family of unknown function (DUF6228)
MIARSIGELGLIPPRCQCSQRPERRPLGTFPHTGPADRAATGGGLAAPTLTVVTVAVLHSAPASPHVGRIEFSQKDRKKDSWAATVALDGEEWRVELDMIGPFVSGMVGFFDEVAREQHGWSGVKRWRSEFSEMTLEARNLGNGLIALTFSLWWSLGDPLDNEREGELHVRADELPAFAARLRELTGVRGSAQRTRQSR